MKFTTLLLITLITANVYGQEEQSNIPTPKDRKVLIGINFSPKRYYRTLKNNDGSTSSDEMIKSLNGEETPIILADIGINVCYKFKKHIGFETGIQYSNKGYATLGTPLQWGFPGSPVSTLSYVYNYYYLDIPAKINFTFGNKKMRFITSAGITTNILIKATATEFIDNPGGQSESSTQQSTNNYKKIDLSPTISAGIDYKIKKRMSLRIEPIFRYGILKIIDKPVTVYLWDVGINFGFYFAL